MGIGSKSQSGFTIVELLIVIVVIGILATIGIVGYGSWRQSAAVAAVKSDLNAAASAMETARNLATTSGYPLTIPGTFTESANVDVTGGGSADGLTFCINGTTPEDVAIKYYIDSSFYHNGAKAGTCALNSSIAIPVKPTTFAISGASSTSISATWTAVSGATSYHAQCASDGSFVQNRVTTTVTSALATVTGLTSGSVFCRVNATNANGTSAWSDTKNTSI